MGAIRNGARSFLNALKLACKFSRMPGFQLGLISILGDTVQLTNLLTAWEQVCVIVDQLVALDNFYNQIDGASGDGAAEDGPPEA